MNNSQNEQSSNSRVDIISQSKKKLSMKKNIIRTMFRLIKDELGLKELTDQKNKQFQFNKNDEKVLDKIIKDEYFPIYFSINDFRSFAKEHYELQPESITKINIQALMEKFTQRKLIQIVNVNKQYYRRKQQRELLAALIKPQKNNDQKIKKLKKQLSKSNKSEFLIEQSIQIQKNKKCKELIAFFQTYPNNIEKLQSIENGLKEKFKENEKNEKFLRKHKLFKDEEKQILVLDQLTQIKKKLNEKNQDPDKNPKEKKQDPDKMIEEHQDQNAVKKLQKTKQVADQKLQIKQTPLNSEVLAETSYQISDNNEDQNKQDDKNDDLYQNKIFQDYSKFVQTQIQFEQLQIQNDSIPPENQLQHNNMIDYCDQILQGEFKLFPGLKISGQISEYDESSDNQIFHKQCGFQIQDYQSFQNQDFESFQNQDFESVQNQDSYQIQDGE